MKYKKILPRFLFLMLVLSSVGCVRVDAGSTIPTVGARIFDLVEAHENGLISDEEFQSLRRALIRNMGR
ncbi:MAG: hypothetical protein O6945_16560 [Gammaproteobacteria bacterium]|nr:hypothetical protein [Gammaproteobacteria bacterium]